MTPSPSLTPTFIPTQRLRLDGYELKWDAIEAGVHTLKLRGEMDGKPFYSSLYIIDRNPRSRKERNKNPIPRSSDYFNLKLAEYLALLIRRKSRKEIEVILNSLLRQ